MPYFVLFYEVVDDFVERRAPYRGDHLQLVREAHARGEILMADALEEPTDRALLVFRAPLRSVVEEFARNDPYVINGTVIRWEVRPWANVLGDDAVGGTPGGG